MPPVVDETLELPDGRRVGYRIRGERTGMPILHIHGQPGSRMETDLWSDAVLEAAGAWVIAYDRPGMGCTDPAPVRDMIDDLGDPISLLDHLGVRRVAVIGLSAGGGPAMALSAAHPTRVVRTILSSATGPYDDEAYMTAEDIAETRQLRAHGAGAMEDEYAQDRDQILGDIDAAMARWFSGFPRSERDWALQGPGRALLATDMQEALRQGSRGWLRETEVRALPWTFDLESIQAPVRAIHGERDEWERVDNIRRVIDKVPDGKLTVIPGGNHLAPLLRPERLIAAAMGTEIDTWD